ncbi:MAG TPA: hypothetical protein VG734_20665 [Lacunisphaera sp.]|nr:hypothetical protein [Lacunisphaera sp.]
MLSKIGTPEGVAMAHAEIRRTGMPTYGADPAHPGLIVQHLPSGEKRYGRMVDGCFVPSQTS